MEKIGPYISILVVIAIILLQNQKAQVMGFLEKVTSEKLITED
ncbi:MAG: hypothetical protein ACPLF9_08445 [Methanothermobacter tenebrarum]